MKKRFLIFLILLPVFLISCAAAEDSSGDCWRVVWPGGQAYSCGTVAEVPVLVLTNDPAQQTQNTETIAEEIRFFPFDENAGLFSSDGQPAGSRIKILDFSGNPLRYVVKMTEPGKYTIAGNEFYVLDIRIPALFALQEELDAARVSCLKKNETQTAAALHDWLCNRVKSVIPEEDANLAGVCADPMNSLLTGYAVPEAYAPLYRLLLNTAGIRNMTVTGTVKDTPAAWTLCRLDGNWVFTDTALDDVNDKKQKKYLALDEAKISQDHTLDESYTAFVTGMLRTPTIDCLLDGTLSPSMLKVYQAWDSNLMLFMSDDPLITVSDRSTVTIHVLSNETDALRNMTPEQFLDKHLRFEPWLPEEHIYCWDPEMYETHSDPNTMLPNGGRKELNVPALQETCTVESASEDLSTITLTFRRPGRYHFTDNEQFSFAFYLISPEQEELATLAAEFESVAAEARSAATEKAAAQQLVKWIRSKVKYNYTYYNWEKTLDPSIRVSFRDIWSSDEPFGALLYGQTVCAGYSEIYNLLMHEAGLTSFIVGGGVGKDFEGHVWNVNRLEGEWSYTDVTWNRFAWSKEKMDKDHEPGQFRIMNGVFFGNSFDLLADQFIEDYPQMRCLPEAVKFLPLKLEGNYGFEGHANDLIVVTDLSESDAGGTSVEISKVAKITMVQMKDGTRVTGNYGNSGKPVTRFSADKVAWGEPFLMEIGTREAVTFLKKPYLFEMVEYAGGVPVSSSCRYYAPDKSIPGYSSYAHRCWEYSIDGKPVSAGWYLPDEYKTMEITVWFDDEGNAERYTVVCDIFHAAVPEKISWTATTDGTLIEYKGHPVEDPDEIRISAWDPIFFR